MASFFEFVASSPVARYNFYHGKTGVVFNVTKTAVGVEVTKVTGSWELSSGFSA